MVRHTPEFLRQRNSNMSLRTAALSASTSSRLSSFANPADFEETKPSTSKAEKAFVVGELDRHINLSLCASCEQDIPEHHYHPDQLEVRWSPVPTKCCSACKVMDTKPEIFTQPFCSFLKENPTIFHTVEYFKEKMTRLNYKEVRTVLLVWRAHWDCMAY